MKFRFWEMIVLPVVLVLAIVFSFLHTVWGGFVYFSSSLFLIFMGFFINNRIYYIRNLKAEYDEGIETYFVELYNNGLITKQQFEEADDRVVKGYYKDYRRTKTLTILLIVAFALVLVGVCLTIFKVW